MKNDITRCFVSPIAFSDHNSVTVHFVGNRYLPLLGRSYWKVNYAILKCDDINENFLTELANIKSYSNYKKNFIRWWIHNLKILVKTYYKYGEG